MQQSCACKIHSTHSYILTINSVRNVRILLWKIEWRYRSHPLLTVFYYEALRFECFMFVAPKGLDSWWKWIPLNLFWIVPFSLFYNGDIKSTSDLEQNITKSSRFGIPMEPLNELRITAIHSKTAHCGPIYFCSFNLGFGTMYSKIQLFFLVLFTILINGVTPNQIFPEWNIFTHYIYVCGNTGKYHLITFKLSIHNVTF